MRVAGLYTRRAYGESWRTGWQWQPETYDHRNEVGGDGGKAPPMIVNTLEAPPIGTPLLRRLLLLKVG